MSTFTGSSSNEKNNETATPSTATCGGCGQEFPSKNAIFKHLKETDGACLSKEDHQDFVMYLRRNTKLQKTIILYGYIPFHQNDDMISTTTLSFNLNISNGQDAGRIILETIQEWQDKVDGIIVDDDAKKNNKMTTSSYERINRSYGTHGRNSEFLQQDENTGAISEVMAVKLRPLRRAATVEQWLDAIQDHLESKYKSLVDDVAPIRILGRLDMPNPKFNAEKDVSNLKEKL
jgi:hypothetical protein